VANGAVVMAAFSSPTKARWWRRELCCEVLVQGSFMVQLQIYDGGALVWKLLVQVLVLAVQFVNEDGGDLFCSCKEGCCQ